MHAIVLKPFCFAADGLRVVHLQAGMTVDLPDYVMPGLAREGFVRAVPASSKEPVRAPETTAIFLAPEHSRSDAPGGSSRPGDPIGNLSALRADYRRITGKRPFPGWDAAELSKRIAAATDR